MIRLSVNVTDDTAEALRTIAARRGETVTEQVRRAVAVYEYLTTAQNEGQTIRTVDRDDRAANVRIVA